MRSLNFNWAIIRHSSFSSLRIEAIFGGASSSRTGLEGKLTSRPDEIRNCEIFGSVL